MATAEFSKFADILSTALSQRYLSGFEIAGITGIPSPPLALFIVMLPKAHLTSHSRISEYIYDSDVGNTGVFCSKKKQCSWFWEGLSMTPIPSL